MITATRLFFIIESCSIERLIVLGEIVNDARVHNDDWNNATTELFENIENVLRLMNDATPVVFLLLISKIVYQW